MPTTTDLDNPHDQHDDPLLHEAWEEGVQAAQDGMMIEREMDLYDDPTKTVAYLRGYMQASEVI